VTAATLRRRLPRAEREQQLLDVAERLFAAKGYERTSIEDVAREAGVTRPIVYQHHGSKEGLYLACVKRGRDRFAAEQTAAVEGIADPRERLRVGGDAFFAMIERDPARWVALFGGGSPVIGELAERLAALRLETIAFVTRNVAAAAAPGVDRERIEAAAHAITGVGEQLGTWWIAHPEVPRERVVDYYTELIWGGIGRFAGA
jgi:AcrR family transcriptional regulator